MTINKSLVMDKAKGQSTQVVPGKTEQLLAGVVNSKTIVSLTSKDTILDATGFKTIVLTAPVSMNVAGINFTDVTSYDIETMSKEVILINQSTAALTLTANSPKATALTKLKLSGDMQLDPNQGVILVHTDAGWVISGANGSGGADYASASLVIDNVNQSIELKVDTTDFDISSKILRLRKAGYDFTSTFPARSITGDKVVPSVFSYTSVNGDSFVVPAACFTGSGAALGFSCRTAINVGDQVTMIVKIPFVCADQIVSFSAQLDVFGITNTYTSTNIHSETVSVKVNPRTYQTIQVAQFQFVATQNYSELAYRLSNITGVDNNILALSDDFVINYTIVPAVQGSNVGVVPSPYSLPATAFTGVNALAGYLRNYKSASGTNIALAGVSIGSNCEAGLPIDLQATAGQQLHISISATVLNNTIDNRSMLFNDLTFNAIALDSKYNSYDLGTFKSNLSVDKSMLSTVTLMSVDLGAMPVDIVKLVVVMSGLQSDTSAINDGLAFVDSITVDYSLI